MELIDRYKLWKRSHNCVSAKELMDLADSLPAIEFDVLCCRKCGGRFSVLETEQEKFQYCPICGEKL